MTNQYIRGKSDWREWQEKISQQERGIFNYISNAEDLYIPFPFVVVWMFDDRGYLYYNLVGQQHFTRDR